MPVRASANLTLAHLPFADRRVNDQLRHLLDPPDGLVAVALAYRMGDAIPGSALSVLVDATSHDLPHDLTRWDRALRGFVALALQRLGPA